MKEVNPTKQGIFCAFLPPLSCQRSHLPKTCEFFHTKQVQRQQKNEKNKQLKEPQKQLLPFKGNTATIPEAILKKRDDVRVVTPKTYLDPQGLMRLHEGTQNTFLSISQAKRARLLLSLGPYQVFWTTKLIHRMLLGLGVFVSPKTLVLGVFRYF